MCRDNNCTRDDLSTIDDSNDNCSDFYHDGHYDLDFNYQNHDNFDHDNANYNFGNHNSGNNNFSFINNYINRSSDNYHDSINALDNQLDAILHCFGSKHIQIYQ